MNHPDRRRHVFHRIMMAAWGLGTVILVFTVAILVYVLLQQEHVALAPEPQPAQQAAPQAAPQAAAAPAETPEQLAPTKEVDLYFADPQALRLVPEKAQIEITDFTSENCRRAIEALIAGPKGALSPILPQGVDLRGVYLLADGELIVDFTLDLAIQMKKLDSASAESLMIYGLVNTLAQPAIKGSREPAVTKVRLLLEGSTRESFPIHLDASAPFSPDMSWVAGAKS